MSGSFSISFWANVKVPYDGQSFVGKHTAKGDNLFLFGIWDGGYQVTLHNKSATFGTPEPGWHHFAVVVQSGCVPTSGYSTFISVYKDGVLLGKSKSLGTPILSSDYPGLPWVVGQEWDGASPSDYLTGSIDELRFYQGSISADDIQSQYRNGLSSHFSTMALGNGFTCVTTPGNKVKCWGHDEFGQLGMGGMGGLLSIKDVVLDSNDQVKALVAGDTHVCALLSTGKVKCWGNNSVGQLGTGSAQPSYAYPTEVQGLDHAVAIAAGGDHTCAIFSKGNITGRVRCWGGNKFGQLGDGTIVDKNISVEVPYLLDAQKISLGTNHSCIIDSVGHLRCWGDNQFGQQWDATTKNHSIPTSASMWADQPLDLVSARNGVTCAGSAKQGILYCLGNPNFNSAIINGTVSKPCVGGYCPLGFYFGPNVFAVNSDSDHSCMISSDQNVSCWGDYNLDQLGSSLSGKQTTKDLPSFAQVALNPSGTAVEVALGQYHTCARLADNSVTCWGEALDVGVGGQSPLGATATAFANGANHNYYKQPVVIPADQLCPKDTSWKNGKCDSNFSFMNSFSSFTTYFAVKFAVFATSQPSFDDTWKSTKQTLLDLYQKIWDAEIALEKVEAAAQVDLQKNADTQLDAILSGKIAAPTTASSIAKSQADYQTAAKTLTDDVALLNDTYIALLKSHSSDEKYDVKVASAFQEATSIYLSALFVAETGDMASVQGVSLLKYLQDPNLLLNSLNFIQTLSLNSSLVLDQGLTKALLIIDAVLATTLGSDVYVASVTETLTRNLIPVFVVVYDLDKSFGNVPSAKIIGKFVNSYNTQVGNLSLNIPVLYLYNPQKKAFVAQSLCCGDESADKTFAAALPGQAGSLTTTQVCQDASKSWSVTSDSDPTGQCIDAQRILSLIVDPVLRGDGSCTLWDTARIGKACCPKKTSQLTRGIQKILFAISEFLMPSAEAADSDSPLLSRAEYHLPLNEPAGTLWLEDTIKTDRRASCQQGEHQPTQGVAGLVGKGVLLNRESMWCEVQYPGLEPSQSRDVTAYSLLVDVYPYGDHGVVMGRHPTWDGFWSLGLEDGHFVFRWRKGAKDARGTHEGVLISRAQYPANHWYQVAVTYDADANKVQLYVNKEFAGEAANNNVPLPVGFHYLNGTANAVLDEVAAFPYALRADEIQQLYRPEAVAPVAVIAETYAVPPVVAIAPVSEVRPLPVTPAITPVQPAAVAPVVTPTVNKVLGPNPFGFDLSQFKFISGGREPPEKPKSVASKLLLPPPMTVAQATDQMFNLSKVIIRGIPVSQRIFPVSHEDKNTLYATDTVIQVNETIRGTDLGKTITIRDLRFCAADATQCTLSDKQRIPSQSTESIYFLVPSPEKGVWYLTDHTLAHGELHDGKMQSIGTSLGDIRSRVQKAVRP